MATNFYRFVTRWRAPATDVAVYDLLRKAEDLPRWWPAVYLHVTTLTPAGPHGLGGEAELHTKGWLPYTLRWRSKMTAADYPHGFTVNATGDFSGTGVWTFTPQGDEVAIRFDWQISADKPLLRRLSWLCKPVFAANHRWAMAQGEISLHLELARRRARTPAERDAVAAPPGPTFQGWPWRRTTR